MKIQISLSKIMLPKSDIPSSAHPVMVTNTHSGLYSSAGKFMAKQVDKYSKHATGTTSSPAAPDSSKFSATHSGMIEYAKNTEISGGAYGISRFYQNFVKIGSNVDKKIAQKMKIEFETWLKKLTGTDEQYMILSDGWSVSKGSTSGSNWGGYGIEFKRLDEKAAARYAKVYDDYLESKSSEGVKNLQ